MKEIRIYEGREDYSINEDGWGVRGWGRFLGETKSVLDIDAKV